MHKKCLKKGSEEQSIQDTVHFTISRDMFGLSIVLGHKAQETHTQSQLA